MKLSEANRIITQYQGSYMLDKINKFDFSIFKISHFKLVDDFCRGVNKQEYKTENGHLFTDKLDIVNAASELRTAMITISRSEMLSWNFKLFEKYLEKFPINFSYYVTEESVKEHYKLN